MFSIIVLLLELMFLTLKKSGTAPVISNVGATLLILVFSVCLVIDVNSNKRLKRLYSSSLILGYFFRLAILYFDMYGHRIYVLPNMVGDATVFYREAVVRAQAITAGMTVLPGTRGVFPQMMARLFSYIGTNRIYGQFLCMLWSIVALLFFAYALAKLDISDEIKKRTYLLVCLLPNFAILSSAFLRESIVYAFLSISLYHFISWEKAKNDLNYIFACVFVLPAAFFHSGAIAALVAYLALLVVYDNRSRMLKVRLRNAFIAVILVAIFTVFITNSGSAFLGKFSKLDSLEDVANTSTLGRTSYAKYVGNSNNPINVVIYTLPRLFFFLFSPLPWMWGGLGDIIAFFFSSLFYIVVIVKAYRAMRVKQYKNRSELITMILIAAAITFVFAWGSANAGTAARHRDKMAILYGLIYALSTPQEVVSLQEKYIGS